MKTIILKLLKFAIRGDFKSQKLVNALPNSFKKSFQKSLFKFFNISVKSLGNVVPLNVHNDIFNDIYNIYLRLNNKKTALSTFEKRQKEFIENMVLTNNKESTYSQDTFYFVGSSWLEAAIYDKVSTNNEQSNRQEPIFKTVKIKTKKSNKWYVFYNVPKTKLMDLLLFNGRYMWLYFGRKYSTNPTHWIPKHGARAIYGKI